MRIIFILPGRGGGGGAHSVIQETMGLKRMGVDVAVASTQQHSVAFRNTYPELETHRISNPLFNTVQDLQGVIADYDLAIATTAPSANQLAAALKALGEGRKPKPAYYVQDYEPLFFTPGTPEWDDARASYTALPGALLFAKTDWLCAMVNQNHNVVVSRVKASIDHDTYYPDARPLSDRVTISAMIRPKTMRRAPRRTVRILERIVAALGDRVQVTSFGCDRADLDSAGLKLSESITHLGVLARKQVASTLRASDMFLDLSDFQAFGRTGLEGMACGCVPVLPLFGGAWEYARHRDNAYLVDPRSDEAILDAVEEFVSNDAKQRGRMRLSAIDTALGYSIHRAAFSEYEIFTDALGLAA